MSDEFDIERPGELQKYLRASGRIEPDERVETRVLPGGVSNRTVLIRRATGQEWVIKQALAKFRQFGTMLGTIHAEGYRLRSDTSRRFADRSFFESLRIEPYYLCTAGQVPEARDFLMHLVEQTRATQLTVVHGDYSPKNVLI